MEENMTTTNVLDIMAIAETYNIEVLKSKTMNFILENAKSVILANSKWHQIPQETVVNIMKNIVSHHVK